MEEAVTTILKGLLESFGFPFESITHSEVAGQHVFSIHTTAAPALIGGRGDVLHAIDLIVKRIYEKQHPVQEGEDQRFLIDVNDYQVNRIKEIQTKALMMAERARSFQYDVELTPMSAYERLIVHTTLQDAPHIKTESLGEGRGRRVVIKYSA
jgi:spoIIIJ-associated protein